jgi:energy-coupling factor transporter ATP-binding protein EcfA2
MNNSLKIDKMTFHYPNTSKSIFKDLSKEYDGGTAILVEGNNGSGKTTLGRLLCGLLRPCSGKILINDSPIVNYSSSKKIKFAFYIEQKNQYQFFKDSLKSEIRLTEKVSDNLQKEDLHELFFIQEHIEMNPMDISVNQAWRFLLFLSTIYEPVILYIDEIPSSSNSKNIIALKNLIRYRNEKDLLTFVSNQRYVEINFREILQL